MLAQFLGQAGQAALSLPIACATSAELLALSDREARISMGPQDFLSRDDWSSKHDPSPGMGLADYFRTH
jgi:hypothetical protein